MTSQASVGIIGAGVIVQTVHLPVLLAVPNIRIAWIADVREGLAHEVAKAFGVPYANADESNHAPNENLEVARFIKGIKTGAAVLACLGAMRR